MQPAMRRVAVFVKTDVEWADTVAAIRETAYYFLYGRDDLAAEEALIILFKTPDGRITESRAKVQRVVPGKGAAVTVFSLVPRDPTTELPQKESTRRATPFPGESTSPARSHMTPAYGTSFTPPFGVARPPTTQTRLKAPPPPPLVRGRTPIPGMESAGDAQRVAQVATPAPPLTRPEPVPRAPTPLPQPGVDGKPADGAPDGEKAAQTPAPPREEAPRAVDVEESPADLAEATDSGTLYSRIHKLTTDQKRVLALTGNRSVRAILARDVVKQVHLFVLKNPRIGTDEVSEYARYPGLSPEALSFIAVNGVWMKTPGLRFSLIKNPNVPHETAQAVVDSLNGDELRFLGKSAEVRTDIATLARKVMEKKGML